MYANRRTFVAVAVASMGLLGLAQDPMGADYGFGQDPMGGMPQQGAPMNVPNVGGGAVKRRSFLSNLVWGAAGAVGMHFYEGYNRKALSKGHVKEKEKLTAALTMKRMEMQQLQMVVQQYEYQIHELQQALYESESESLQRDYDEFKAPDQNGDDVITRSEFGTCERAAARAWEGVGTTGATRGVAIYYCSTVVRTTVLYCTLCCTVLRRLESVLDLASPPFPKRHPPCCSLTRLLNH